MKQYDNQQYNQAVNGTDPGPLQGVYYIPQKQEGYTGEDEYKEVIPEYIQTYSGALFS